jgi:serine protease Do
VNSELLVLVSLDRVQNAGDILVNISDQVSVKAKLRDYEKDINLAVIAASLKDVPDALLNNIVAANFGESYTLSVGSPVIALGSPNGHPDSMEVGIITSRDISVSVTDNQLDLFNTSINDNEDSDGIIVNMNGEVIGLITRTLKEDVNKGLSTAIGISKVKEIIEKMGNQEPRIYFGIKAEDMTGDAMKVHHVENGIYVDDVKGDSPALDGGIKSGDIILRVNKEDVLNISNFNTIISAYQPGKKVTVRIKRTSASKEKEMNIKVVLAERGYKKD